MTIEARIPALTDVELENLRANAVRLSQSGAPAQKVEAERLLPIIVAEADVRLKARAELLAAKRAASRKPTARKAAAASPKAS